MKANKIRYGIGIGIIAGILDVIPMILQKLTWDANLSAFSMWVIIGFILAISELKLNGIFKGIMISFLILLPSAILIGWKEPISLVPISVMTLILGSLLGYFIDKFGSDKS
jgi:CHASE2 domain-containing sensor protein